MANILVVDDDPLLLETVKKILETRDHAVSTAPDGKTALEEFAHLAPDLVLTDIYMPEMDGIEFLIRMQSTFPEARIVTMSGGGFKAKEDVLAMAQKLGSAGTLEKPFSMDEVLKIVRQALGEEDEGGR